MADSLQDQLVKAGLADPKQARKPRGRGDASRGKGKGRGKGKAGNRGGQDRSRAAPAAGGTGTPAAGRSGPAPGSARGRTARVRQIVQESRLARERAEIPYRFTNGRRIKEITVTREQQALLARGEAGIVNVEGRFDVVPAEAIERIRGVDEKAVVLLNEPGGDDAGEGDPDDDRPVHDDITW